MAQPPTKQGGAGGHHHHHHHHHAHHITDPARRKKKHLPAQLAQLQLDHEEDGPNNFISSSRDASEEDNDEQEETFDDDASIASLRQHHQGASSSSASNLPISASTSSIPPNERDQVLINSAALHQNRSPKHNATSNDRTPASASPPKMHSVGAAAAQMKAGATQPSQPNQHHPREASSDDDYQRPSVVTTLTNASAALSSSSSTELLPKAIIHRQQTAGTEAPTRASKSSAGLNLGSLPPPVVGAALSSTATASKHAAGSATAAGDLPTPAPAMGILPSSAVTPKAHQSNEAWKELSTTSTTADPATVQASTASKRKTSASQHTSSAASRKADIADEDGDGGNTDGGTPYDGDVEYAARTPVSVQIAHKEGAMQDKSSSSSSGISGQPVGALANQIGQTKSTAPGPVLSRSYIQTMKSRHADCHPQGDDFHEGGFSPSSIPSPEEIQAWVTQAIFHPDPSRDYSINPPPKRFDPSGKERPIRIYADGVYDLFHYAHALQLRQAKLSFPSVHLIVGVVSSYSCAKHKNKPVLNSQERYECVRNCRWVDEVLEDAPWVVDQNLIDTLEIDYIAHDDLPYSGKGMEDIYAFVKRQGRFLPTRRTDGVSTSELLGRIVEVYQHGDLDGKLAKIGLEDLTSKPLPKQE